MNRTHCKHHARFVQGFTLLEILIATMMFAVVLAAMNSIFYSALRLREKAAESVENLQSITYAVNVMKRDLAGAISSGNSLAGDLFGEPTDGGLDQLDQIQFFTTTGIIKDHRYLQNFQLSQNPQQWIDIQKVEYALVDPIRTVQKEGLDLVRAITRNLLPVVEDSPEYQRLIHGVRSLAFLYYDGETWQPSWDSSTAETPLPHAIKVRIEFVNNDTRHRDLDQRYQPPVEFVIPTNIQAQTDAAEEDESATEDANTNDGNSNENENDSSGSENSGGNNNAGGGGRR